MLTLSHIHQLFNVDQCQAYIHTLRWKDRPLQCPRCQSHDVDPWDFLPFVNPNLSIFLPHLHDRLTTNSACIIIGTITQHGHQDAQQSVANIA
jgi:hypothetical protein